MGNTNAVTSISVALNHKFMELLENTEGPANRNIPAVETEFIDSLTPEQQKAYQKLSDMIIELETDRSEFFFRAGFMQGITDVYGGKEYE